MTNNSVFFNSVEEFSLCCDLVRLPHLHYDSGPLLVAVNPFQSLENLYTSDKIKEISETVKFGTDKPNQEPHVFTIAGLAHYRLISQIGQINQIILVSGESGAGKTESARYLITYLTLVELENILSQSDNIGRPHHNFLAPILASNPILEAFGNAATLRNHNSSRFGKLIRLQYSGFNLKGADIKTYLLEKTRVTTQPRGERNFHIFYQVLAAINNCHFSGLDNVKVSSFRITSDYDPNNDLEDLQAFCQLQDALSDVGVELDNQRKVFQAITAVLHLGNINFECDDGKDDWVISSDEQIQLSLGAASGLLGINENALIEALTQNRIVVNRSNKRRTVFNKVCERCDECEEKRNSLMQLLFSSLFNYLVSLINERTAASQSLWNFYLGILDVYGFESFEHNSLEQLCINYANERLQLEFTRKYLASEMKILSEEGFLDFPFIYTDNMECVTALDSSVSVFSILDEECQLRRAVNDMMTCERVCNTMKNSGVILPPSNLRPSSGFIVKHYAGLVDYSSTSLLHKNKDNVPQELMDLLSGSRNAFIANLPLREDRSKIGIRKNTVLSKFKNSLDLLMNTLNNCDLHYIRCLKSNMNNAPGFPDEKFLLNQLKNNGILEAVKISQFGYPVRMLYDEFVSRYNFKKNLSSQSSKEVAAVIARDMLMDRNTSVLKDKEYRFGRKRIFLCEGSLHLLEDARTKHQNMAAICIQKYVRRIQALRTYKDALCKICLLQRFCKMFILRIRFCKMRKACITIQRHVKRWLLWKRQARRQQSVIVLQKYLRRWICKTHYEKALLDIKGSHRSGSSISYISLGYGSLSCPSTANLTEQSSSDAEPFVRCIPSDLTRTFLVTEESGIETDTESLSGGGIKIGRVSKVRSKRELSTLRRRDFPADLSDEDNAQTSGKIWMGNKRLPYSRTVLQTHTEASCTSWNEPTIASLNHFREALSVYRKFKPLGTLELNIRRSLPLYFRDGVLSYRPMPKVSIKFHTRHTCLPFSTLIPHHEIPRGLLDGMS